MTRRMTMTVEEAAEILGISRTSAYLSAARGEIPTRRLGRRVLVLMAPFLEMLGEQIHQAPTTNPHQGEGDAAGPATAGPS